MTREYVLTIVSKHLGEVIDELKGVPIEPSRSMKDLGANSLDMVEIVSRSMRELKVKVPRTELSKLTCIDDLVTALLSAQHLAPATLNSVVLALE